MVRVYMCGEGGGHSKPNLVLPQFPQGTKSRDSAAMEEVCAYVTSTNSGCVAAESGIQQSEDIFTLLQTRYSSII